MKKVKEFFRPWMTLIVFLILVVLVYYLTGALDVNKRNHIGEVIDTVTTAVLAIIVIILVAEALLARRKLIHITKDLIRAAEKIENDKNFLKDENCFEIPFLSECMKEYRRCKDKYLEDGVGVCPDIADYINEQLIYDKTHREITDQIGNTMTGLGILGTFVGLTIGLEKFDSNAAMASTPELLNGIKIAFYTSIFGVIGSMLHSFLYHGDLENNSLALERFQSVFYDRIMPEPEVDYYNKMLDYNDKQTEALDKLAGAIAGELAPQFAKAMAETVNPVMERLNKSIDDYIIRAVDAQSETLGKIVDSFMQMLNDSMNNQFHSLALSIEKMCMWQNQSGEKIEDIMGSVSGIAEKLSDIDVQMERTEELRREINNSTSDIISRLRYYVDAFEEYRQSVGEWTEELKKNEKSTAEHNGTLNKLLEKRTEENVTLIDKLVLLSSSFDEYREHIENAVEMQKNSNFAIWEVLNITNVKTESLVTKMEELLSQIENSEAEHHCALLQNLRESQHTIMETNNKLLRSHENVIIKAVERIAQEIDSVSGISKTIEEYLKNKLISERITPLLKNMKKGPYISRG